jgi:fermentation-respiration switch protein FrsA (DUF1100 family)
MRWTAIKHQKRVVWWRLLILFLIFGILTMGVLRLVEDQFIYYPERPYFEEPKRLGLSYRDIWLTTKDQTRIHGWLIGDGNEKPVVLFFHGNAGNISHRLDRIKRLEELPLRFLLLDYRGYGQSEGKPTEEGLYEDALAAYEFLIEEEGLSSDQIILFGESLGGAVAIDLASKKDVAGIILEATFTTLRELANEIFPVLPTALVSDQYTSILKVPKIDTPILFVHGTRDEIVPFKMGETLFKAAKGNKDFWEVQNAGHNDLYLIAGQEYNKKLSTFLEGLENS